jgi:intracellular sulfur oxidation DsrE/DsrF family protein
MLKKSLLLVLAFSLLGLSSAWAADKAIYDVRISKPKALLFALKVIEETSEGMIAQGMKPEFVLAFRGGTLKLLTTDPEFETDAEQKILTEVRQRLKTYRKKGMVLEACGVAAGIFDIDKEELDPNLHLVTNSLISLIDYQNRGYALVPMY